MAHYDVLIKNGMVIDGKRGAMRHADVGVDKETIKYIGDLKDSTGDLVIDASGQYVAPGFIDITNHSDTHWRLFIDPGQDSYLYQGVTTILGGVCGSSLAPLVSGEDIEGIKKWVDISQINFNWQSVDELFEELEKHEFGVNFATLIGHGTLRRGIVGDEARPLRQLELDQMQLLLERALKSGAFGLSTSLGSAHGRSAEDDEIIELLRTVAEHDALSKHHLKDEGINILPAISQLFSFIRKTGAKCQISHLKAIGRRSWEHLEEINSMISQMNNEGFHVAYDVFPYTRTGSNLYMLLPSWSLEGGRKMIIENIRDNKKRSRLIDSLKEATLHYDRITIASSLRDTLSVGKTIKEIAENAGKSPEEVFLDLLNINDLNVAIFNEVIKPENLEDLIKRKYAAIASDGVGYGISEKIKKDLPHPRSFGTFPRVLAKFVKEKKILSWEDAIYKMTGLPKSILGLRDRGVLEHGMHADIVVFNPETITDKATYNNPYQFSEGVSWVFVNGKAAIENGKKTESNSGMILKK